MSEIILTSLGISMIILIISASIMMLHESKIFNNNIYVLRTKDDDLIGAFGSKDEVLSFFWSLCDTTKDNFIYPMFKSNSFRVAKFYLNSFGYKLDKIKPEGLDYVEHN